MEGGSGQRTLADALLDLARRPDLIARLQDAPKADRLGILQEEYPDVFEGNRGDYLLPDGEGSGLRQIRLRIEADIAASPPKTHSITFVWITF
jgi:hypothetical protein